MAPLPSRDVPPSWPRGPQVYKEDGRPPDGVPGSRVWPGGGWSPWRVGAQGMVTLLEHWWLTGLTVGGGVGREPPGLSSQRFDVEVKV